jgi:uncharacterized protein YoxC
MSDINLIISATDKASGPLGNIQGKLAGVTSAAATTGGGFTQMGGKIKAALGIAAGAFAAFQGIQAINNRISEMDELAKRARTVGAATTEGFAGFQVASQLLAEGGLSAQEADRAFNNLQLRLAEGAKGNKAYAEIMGKLGDSVFDANGQLKTAPDLFESVATAVQEGTLSVDEASKILGQRVGPKIVGIFTDLAAGGTDVKTALAEVAENTNIVPLEAAQNAELFGDTMERIRQVLGKVMTEALTPLLPILVDLAQNVLANLPAIVEKVQKGFQSLEPVFSLIGTVLTDLVFPIMSKIFDILGKVAEAIAPLVEASIPLLISGFEKVVETVEIIVEKIQGFIDSIKSVGETVANITGGVKDKVKDMASGVAENVSSMADNMKNKIGNATESVTGFFSGMYESVVGGSIVPDMVDEVLLEFDRQTAGMIEKARQATTGVMAEFEKLGTQAIEGGMITGGNAKNVEDILSINKKLNEERETQLRIAKRNNVALQTMDSLFNQGIGTIGDYIKMYETLGIKQETFTSRSIMTAKQISDGFGAMSQNLTNSFTDVILGLSDGFTALQDIALNVIKMIVQALVQNFIVSPLIRNIQNAIMGTTLSSGGMGGFGSLLGIGGSLLPGFGLLAGAGMLLGGFLADGGPAKAGTPYIVGERGPELFVPNSSGRVVANEELNMGNQGDLNVNFTINAIDTQQGVEFLLQNKRVITGVVQEAYRRRGTSGPLG